MVQLLQLEEFVSGRFRGVAANEPEHPDNETQRMANYEKGYQAGYDDAAFAISEDQTRISAEFSLHLQDLGFTFHEARSHVIRSLEPLMAALVEKLLPEMVAKSIGQQIVDEVIQLAESVTEAPIQIVVAPDSRLAIEPLLAASTTCPLDLVEEPTLGPGQAFLRSGKVEKYIDLQCITRTVTNALAALNHENSKTLVHA